MEAQGPDLSKAYPLITVAGTFLAAGDAADYMVFGFMPSYLSDRGVSKASIGLVLGSLSVGILTLTPFMSELMPRLGGPAKSLFLGSLIFALLRFLSAIMPLFDPTMPNSDSSFLVYSTTGLFFLTGFTYSLIEVGSLAWVLATVPEDKRTEANSQLMMTRSAGTLIGPLAGGATFNAFGSGDLGYVMAMLLGVIILLLPLFAGWRPVREAVSKHSDRVSLSLSGSSSGMILKVPACALAYAIMISATVMVNSNNAFAMPYLKAQHGIDEWLYGVLMMLGVMGFMVGAGLALPCEKAVGGVASLLIGTTFLALGELLLAPTPLLGGVLPNDNVWLPACALNVVTFGLGIVSTIITPLIISYAARAGFSDEDASVQAAALQVFVIGIALFIGPPLGGVLADAVGAEWALTYLGLFTVGINMLLSLGLVYAEPPAVADHRMS